MLEDPRAALERPAKPSAASRTTLSRITLSTDANAFGAVHGGVLLRLADECGAIAALRHAESSRITTAALDSFVFLAPIAIGMRIEAQAEVSHVGRSSLESKIEIFAEPLQDPSARRKVAEGYALYVALDEFDNPRPVPRLLVETETDRRRACAAQDRQAVRLARRNDARADSDTAPDTKL